jgi:flagellar biosynthesis protein FliR
MVPLTPDTDARAIACLAGGAAVRIVAATIATSRGTLADLPLRVTVCAAIALVVAALPAVAGLPAAGVVDHWSRVPLVLVGEMACGWALGTVAAMAIGLGGWSGSMLAGPTGLAWDDDLPAGDPQSAGIARLGWWMGAAAFLATGGCRTLVTALLWSLEAIPVGMVTGGAAVAPLADPGAILVSLPGAALELALGLAMPALVAVIACHLSIAMCLRTIRFVPGPGVVQGLVAALVLASLLVTAPAWSGRAATAASSVIELATGGTPAG